MENTLDFDQAKLNKAHKVLDECSARYENIAKAKAEVLREVGNAQERLNELNRDWPITLAKYYLKKIQKDELDQVLAERGSLQLVLDNGKIAVEGLWTLEEQVKNDSRQAQSVIDKGEAFAKYEKLKVELRQKYDEDRLTELRKAAHTVSHYGSIQRDFADFIQELQGIHKSERIIRHD